MDAFVCDVCKKVSLKHNKVKLIITKTILGFIPKIVKKEICNQCNDEIIRLLNTRDSNQCCTHGYSWDDCPDCRH